MFATVYVRTLGFTQPPTDAMEMSSLKMHRVITSVRYTHSWGIAYSQREIYFYLGSCLNVILL